MGINQNMAGSPRPVRRAIGLMIARLALVAAATLAAWLIVRAIDGSAGFPPTPMLAALSLAPVNVLCLYLTHRALRSEGQTLRSLFAPRAGWAREIGWGMLWLAVLYLPFVLTVFLTMLALHGDETMTAFETVFYDPNAAAIASPGWSLALGILAFVTFAPLNAPAEESLYRGYAQSRLTSAWGAPVAILASSVVFGLQHAFFAPTADAMVVYVAAFTVWGIGSGIIVQRQGRLLPITIAHFVVNLMTSAGAVVVPILQLTGTIPT